MTPLEFLIARWYVPAIFSLFIFAYFYYRNDLISRSKKAKKPKTRFRQMQFLDSLKIELGDWRKTILIPIFVGILAQVVPAIIFQVKPSGMNEPLWFAGLTSGFFTPVFEEFAVRGCVLGVILALAETRIKYGKDKNPVLTRQLAYWGGLFVSTAFFTLLHERFTFYQITALFISGLSYGMLYLIGKRNLLPAMVAHAAGNWFLILNDAYNITGVL